MTALFYFCAAALVNAFPAMPQLFVDSRLFLSVTTCSMSSAALRYEQTVTTSHAPRHEQWPHRAARDALYNRTVVTHLTAAACASATQSPVCGPQTDTGPCRADERCLGCARASCGICSRRKWDAVQARFAGDGSSRGSRPASGNASTKRYWPSCVAAKLTSHVRSSTVHRFAPYWRGKKLARFPRTGAGSAANTTSSWTQGIPLAVILSAANCHDITQLAGCAGRCHSTYPGQAGTSAAPAE